MSTEHDLNQETEVTAMANENTDNKPTVDYSTFSLDELIAALVVYTDKETIIKEKKIIDEIKRAFYDTFNDSLVDTNTEDPEAVIVNDKLYLLKTTFETKYFEIKEIQKQHYKKVETSLKQNLQERLDIIEELKNLVSPENTETNKFGVFSTLSDRWKNAGPTPKDKYNHLWNNYHFHVENFFDYIHLDKEARDLEFKSNYEKKIKILERLNDLLSEKDLKKALNEFKLLQNSWREVGPVERNKRQELWDAFDYINSLVEEKRKNLKALLREEEISNLAQKNELIIAIQELTTEPKNSIDFWNTQSKKLQSLKDSFMSIGRTPKASSDNTWANFRSALKEFNTQKNNYFKILREEQNINIAKKKALIAKAQEVEKNEDITSTIEVVKQLQRDWKKIGHVPSKFSNPLWQEFKTSCDNFFNRLHEQKNIESEQEIEAFNQKTAYLKSIEKTKLSESPEKGLEEIQLITTKWNEIGRVPFSKIAIQEEFNQFIDSLYNQIQLDANELDLLKFRGRLDRFKANNDTDKLLEEERFISKKINDERTEINQLENNISFFSTNGKKENPFLKEIEKTIAKNKESLNNWKIKLGILRNLK